MGEKEKIFLIAMNLNKKMLRSTFNTIKWYQTLNIESGVINTLSLMKNLRFPCFQHAASHVKQLYYKFRPICSINQKYELFELINYCKNLHEIEIDHYFDKCSKLSTDKCKVWINNGATFDGNIMAAFIFNGRDKIKTINLIKHPFDPNRVCAVKYSRAKEDKSLVHVENSSGDRIPFPFLNATINI